MKQNKILEFYVVKILIILEYFIILVLGYFLSINQGNLGIAIDGIMGQNDSFAYYSQISTNLSLGTNLNYTGTYFVPMMTLVGRIFHTESVFFLKTFNFLGFILMISTIGLIVKQVSYNLKTSTNVFKRIILFPSMILAISIPFGRDGWIYLFFFLSVYFLLKLQDIKNNKLYLVLFFISLYLLFKFREYAGVSVLLGLFINFFDLHIKKKATIVIALFFSFIVWFEFFSYVKFPIINLSLHDALIFQSGETFNTNGQLVGKRTGDSDFMGSFNPYNIIVFLMQLVISYLGNLIGPFIWQLKSIPMLIIFIFESIPMIGVVFSLFRQRKQFAYFLNEHPKYKIILAQIFSWLTMIALTNKNIGTGLRLKIPLFIFIWIVYYGFKNETNKKRM